jgi:hypothetical protein
LADRAQHLHVFGVGIVVREGVVEIGVERDHFAADRFQHLRREGARRAVAAGGDDLQRRLSFGRPVSDGDVALGHVIGTEL